MPKLPDRSCPFGYTQRDLEAILDDDLPNFQQWMNGQTMAVCDGRTYDHDLAMYRDSPCVYDPHGVVVYAWDLERYVTRGRKRAPVLD